MNTYRDSGYSGQAAAPEKGARHWLGYGFIATMQALTGLVWFLVALTSVSYKNDNSGATSPTGFQSLPGTLITFIYAFINEYSWRIIATFASLIVTYNADRYFMSRGAAWASWTVNLMILFSWLATDLPFVHSAFSDFTGGDNITANNSLNSYFCNNGAGGLPTHWCRLLYAHAVMSVIQDFVVFCTFLYACYQMARARSNILLTWSEVAAINLTALGLCGYIVWTCSSINLGITYNYNVWNYLDPIRASDPGVAGPMMPSLNTWRMAWPSLIWANYLIHASYIFALGTAALVSFGATKASRMTALVLNWMSFFLVFPAFIFLARHQNQGSAGQCANDHFNGNLRCESLDGVAVGMGFAAATTFLLGFDLMAVYAQPERADFAIAKGQPAMASGPQALDATRPPTPTGGVVNQPIMQGSGMNPMNMTTSNVELGQPVYRQEVAVDMP